MVPGAQESTPPSTVFASRVTPFNRVLSESTVQGSPSASTSPSHGLQIIRGGTLQVFVLLPATATALASLEPTPTAARNEFHWVRVSVVAST